MKLIEKGTNIIQQSFNTLDDFEFFYYEEALCLKIDNGVYINFNSSTEESIGYPTTNVGAIDQDSVTLSYKVHRN